MPISTDRPGSSNDSGARPTGRAQPPTAACTPAVPARPASHIDIRLQRAVHPSPTRINHDPSPLVELEEMIDGYAASAIMPTPPGSEPSPSSGSQRPRRHNPEVGI